MRPLGAVLISGVKTVHERAWQPVVNPQGGRRASEEDGPSCRSENASKAVEEGDGAAVHSLPSPPSLLQQDGFGELGKAASGRARLNEARKTKTARRFGSFSWQGPIDDNAPTPDELFPTSYSMHHDDVSGIYFLYLHETLQYVGKSECFIGRVGHHVTGKKSLFDRAAFLHVPADILNEVELFYILKYDPPLNRTHSKQRGRRWQPSDPLTPPLCFLLTMKEAKDRIEKFMPWISKVFRRTITDGRTFRAYYVRRRMMYDIREIDAWITGNLTVFKPDQDRPILPLRRSPAAASNSRRTP